MIEQKNLTPSQLKYLLKMSEMDYSGHGIRCIDLASSLGIAKSSVHNMIKTFVELGYVSKNENGIAFFTDYGCEAAVRYNRYYSAILSILKKSFPEIEDTDGIACHIISEMSIDNLEKLSECYNNHLR